MAAIHPHSVGSVTIHYKDYRSENPDEVKVIAADYYQPDESTIGARDEDDRETLGGYLLYHYLVHYAEHFKRDLHKKFAGFTPRKHFEMLGFSVVKGFGAN